MITLPDFTKAFEYENNFYLSSDPTRIGKLLAQHQLYDMVRDLPGAIVECGVFKGISLVRFATFRSLYGHACSKKIVGFDVFGKFPETQFEGDIAHREKFIKSAGEESISSAQLYEVLSHKRLDQNVELVEGDILETVPNYVDNHPELRISLLNLDTDIYEPAVVILNHLYPKIVSGGVLLLDDYGVFPGETRAADEFFESQSVRINKFPYCMTPCYVVKP